eukprot:12549946-Ditylum_brightwellii.AAC.1
MEVSTTDVTSLSLLLTNRALHAFDGLNQIIQDYLGPDGVGADESGSSAYLKVEARHNFGTVLHGL